MSTLLHRRQKAIGGKKFLNISKKLCQKQLRGCEGVEILVVKMCLVPLTNTFNVRKTKRMSRGRIAN